MSIYKELCAAREKVSTPGYNQYSKMEVLTQLMGLAFNNESHPDELPGIFYLYNVNCTHPEELKHFLTECEIKVSRVKLVKFDSVRGSIFEVMLV